jgi:very-short-patch-repair endonuclease
MPSANRIMKSGAARGSLRRLFGKAGYFPVTRGYTRKFGFRAAQNDSDGIPDWDRTSGMTLPEWRMSWAHLIIGRKPDSDFFPQYDVFGDGTVRVDFYEVPENLYIEVQGFYAHYVGYDAFKVEKDRERRILLTSTGKVVIFIDDTDAIQDPVTVLRDALRGLDRSRFQRGVA